MVTVNGNQEEIAGMTVADYLASLSYSDGRIAVERNGEIVPKSHYATTRLENGDTVEIVRFVGGG